MASGLPEHTIYGPQTPKEPRSHKTRRNFVVVKKKKKGRVSLVYILQTPFCKVYVLPTFSSNGRFGLGYC